jgi:3-methylfumaryl-CoA hydratase
MSSLADSLKGFIGRSETATDVVTVSAMAKIAATLEVENPATSRGDPIPPGWHGAFFPPLYGPSKMRPDGQPASTGILPAVPLPRRRLGGVRMTFHDPLRIGDEITRVSEVADIRVDEDGSGTLVVLTERNSISSARGLAVVEERDLIWLSDARAGLGSAAPEAPAEAAWKKVVHPDPVLLFRFSAIRFNSHRIHYDRKYVTEVERLPGLSVQGTLVSQLMIEMCRKELPRNRIGFFGYQTVRSIYDTGPFTLLGKPAAGGQEARLWALDAEGSLAMVATAKFA